MFLCHLRSIAAHRDHFVRHLSVCVCVCESFSQTLLPVICDYVSQTTHAFHGMAPCTFWLTSKFCSVNLKYLRSFCFHYFHVFTSYMLYFKFDRLHYTEDFFIFYDMFFYLSPILLLFNLL